MEDKSIQAALWKFFNKINPEIRTDCKMSVMKVDGGYSIQIASGSDSINLFIGMEKHEYLTSYEVE